jgi:polysaccharide export outer membrane protein
VRRESVSAALSFEYRAMHKSYKAMRLLNSVRITAGPVITGVITGVITAIISIGWMSFARADNVVDNLEDAYLVQPGDVLTISVWKEPDLQAEVLVRPDGGLSFPLAGDVASGGLSIASLQQTITKKLLKYIPDPVVTIGVKQASGSHIYVVGKVNRPGEFSLNRPLNVMQALSLAGGATPFASLNDIRVLRRDSGHQTAIEFRYNDVEKGRALDQNILLKSGDTVVVP